MKNIFVRGILTDKSKKIKYKTYENTYYDKEGKKISSSYDVDLSDRSNLFYSKELFEKLLVIDKSSPITPGTLRLFIYVATSLKEDCDQIALGERKIKKELNMGSSSYYKAVKQLVELEVIAPVDDKERAVDYWVNPRFMWRGKRLEYYKAEGTSYLKNVP